MRVLVTGANGFLGRYLLKELQSQGHQTLAFVRSEQSAKTLDGFHCDIHIGSLASVDEIEKALPQVQAVIHAAGGGKANNPESYFHNNVLPTQNLITALKNHPVEKLILVSSFAGLRLPL